MRQRLDHIEGVRALAAMFVMANHGFRMAWPNVPAVPSEMHPEGLLLLWTGWMRYGHFAVTAFIAISGYCLALPLARAAGTKEFSSIEFYVRRAWRILPTYYAALGMSLVLIWAFLNVYTGSQWDACLPVTKRGIFVRIVMLQDLFYTEQINNPFWSVATEFRIYLLMPLIVMGYRHLGAIWTALTTIILVTILHLTAIPYEQHITWTYLCVFTFGGAAAFWPSYKNNFILQKRVLATTLFCLMCAILGFLLSQPFEMISDFSDLCDYLIGAGVALFLLYTHKFADSMLTRALAVRPLVSIGRFSYSIYLMHFPFQALVWIYCIMPLHLSRPKSFGLLLFLGTPVVLLFCWIFFRLFEKPVLDRRPAFVQRLLRGSRVHRADELAAS